RRTQIERKMDKRIAEVFTSIVLISVSLLILLNDNLVEGGIETDLGSMFLPRTIAVLILILSLAIAWPALKELVAKTPATQDDQIDIQGFSGILLYIAAIVGYWLMLPHLGFLISTLIVMFFVAWIFDCKHPRSWLN